MAFWPDRMREPLLPHDLERASVDIAADLTVCSSDSPQAQDRIQGAKITPPIMNINLEYSRPHLACVISEEHIGSPVLAPYHKMAGVRRLPSAILNHLANQTRDLIGSFKPLRVRSHVAH